MISLLEAISSLVAAGVDFVVVGGVALRSHGSSYITQDLDICYSRTRTNLEKLAEALRPLNPRPRNFPDELPFVWDWSTLQNGTNFTFSTSLGDIDLLGEVAGIGDYADVLANSVDIDFEGFTAKVLSIDGLIIAKETAGREKDKLGLQELYALRLALENEAEK
ncbi:MAG: nucleotidyltransferase [Acidobacteria bacterium]|nr:nucleotidyltransferase [Acidobacteriota bacterium]